ncbi:MAG TPA: (2Fe-2S) ferredoxin domain-containing protein [Stenomitos sp.]
MATVRSGDRTKPSHFHLEGQFLGGLPDKHGSLKALKLSTASGMYWIKVAKSLQRSPLLSNLDYRTVIRVTGQRKLKGKRREWKFKAFSIEGMPTHRHPNAPVEIPVKKPIQTQILVCTKSSCRKRGAGGICAALQEGISQRNLTDQVQVVQTGCMKACKAGPHVVIRTDRTQYTRSNPAAVATILDRHFPNTSCPLSAEPKVPALPPPKHEQSTAALAG